jgi:hypothetical protein
LFQCRKDEPLGEFFKWQTRIQSRFGMSGNQKGAR